ncbi:sulfite exporter TauE/SafE family protein 3-like isoform X2 [Juglans regia]|uniref:Sulfite exporter TauE/SafE family protein 3-like isoform X2 n=1 Tax=Juglans regia TaxID=51240 RepID=A0A6P9EP27_JUGRE|nr:sulfite exporter TauE/SafE family protein 3-like isoform X2 [Juglans regia]
MAELAAKWRRWGMRSVRMVLLNFLLAVVFVSAERHLRLEEDSRHDGTGGPESKYPLKAVNLLWQPHRSGRNHVWPEMKFGWKIVVGTIIGFCGAAFGSVGGVGGGGIFVPMLSLIIGFDPKSATAISKCMIMGAAFSTVYFDFKLRHPQLDMPVIDYDLVLLIQPMLMLGISIGVAFNVVFADWMVTVLLIFLFIVISTKALFKGTETWKKETIMNREAAKRLKSNDSGGAEVEYKSLPGGSNNGAQKDPQESEVTILDNVYWKQFGLLVFVWVAFLFLQIAKIPVSFGVSLYQAVGLYKGHRVIASRKDERTNWQVHQLATYCSLGILAGIVGGLLGLGGGFIMAPLFLELGIPPQVSSATANFGMTFSSSMSVVEYYLLKRFPVPYALYFVAVSIVAAFIGQHIVRKLVNLFGRASLIIFILAFTIFISAISLGGVGISNMIGKIQRHEYMGFENLCKYDA